MACTEGTCACGERDWDFEKAPTMRLTVPTLPGMIQYSVPLPLDHMIIKTTEYDILGLDAPMDEWSSKDSQPLGLWAADEANPLGGGGAHIGNRNWLLAKDKLAGNTHFFDAMVACKHFVENTDGEAFDKSDTKRPLAGQLHFQGFTHPSGAAGSGIVLYSPCKFSKAIKAEFDALGGVKGIVVPHAFHTAFVHEYLEAWPDLVFFAGPGLDKEAKPGLFARTTGTNCEVDEAMAYTSPEAVAFMKEWNMDVSVSTLGGFPEANLFAKDSGVFCTSDLLYRDGRGDTFDWCTPIEPCPELDFIDILYSGPQYLVPEEVDRVGGVNAWYRYTCLRKLGGGGDVTKNAYEALAALPGLKGIAACHANVVSWGRSRGLKLMERTWSWAWRPGHEAFMDSMPTYYRDATAAMLASLEANAPGLAPAPAPTATTTTTTVTEAAASGVVKTTTTTMAVPN